jgi:hypothetical protein
MDYYKKYIKYKTKYNHLKLLNKYSSYGGGLNESDSTQLTLKHPCIDINHLNTSYVPMHHHIYESPNNLITAGLNTCTAIFFSIRDTNYGIHSNCVFDYSPSTKSIDSLDGLLYEKLVKLELKPTKIYIIYSQKKEYPTLTEYCVDNKIDYVILNYGTDTFNVVGINNNELIDCEMELSDIYDFPDGNLLPGSFRHSSKRLLGENIELTPQKYESLKRWAGTNKFTIINIPRDTIDTYNISLPGETGILTNITESDIEKILPPDNVAIPPP